MFQKSILNRKDQFTMGKEESVLLILVQTSQAVAGSVVTVKGVIMGLIQRATRKLIVGITAVGTWS